jgi:hypothetical protein
MLDQPAKNTIKSDLFFFLQILAEFELYSESTVGAITTSFDPSSINEQFDIDAMIDPPSNRKLLWNTYL